MERKRRLAALATVFVLAALPSYVFGPARPTFP
jgi:hypothetical protein